ncbi:MAG TPA: FtsH protease activity modulator HflK [Hyphomicrobiaceae bacterium]|nr:FtsH protease activity modulator HflK [Hyphomicrobiaceae bacterium]
MPWNNETGGGGWKSSGGNGGGGGGGPWGQGPWGQGPGGGGSGGGGGGGGQQTPDLEEILKRGQDRLKRAMPGGGGTGIPASLWFLMLVVLAGVVGFYAFTFKVNPNQQGVVLRFGEYVRWEGPGLHFKWPYPVEEVLLPDVTARNQIQIGMRSVSGSRAARSVAVTDIPEESLMLTGDENIVDVDFVVLWRIKTGVDKKTGQTGAEQYLFNIQNPDSTVKEVAESSMREIVGKNDIQPILTQARQKTEADVQKLMQKTLDSYNSGIEVTQVQLQKVDPPGKVIASFRDVQAARADQERLQNEARAYANRVVPEARGQSERILQAAEAYRQQTIAEATGQAARFLKIYDEYKKAPDLTRRRMFLETMEKVFGGTDKIILDTGKGGSGVVPYLPLNELGKSQASKGGN